MSEREKAQLDRLAEKFSKMDEHGKAVLCAFGDGMLAAQQLSTQAEAKKDE